MAAKTQRFVIYRDRKREYRWRLVAKNGKIIADSAEGYKTMRSIKATLMSIIVDMPHTIIEQP